MKISEIRKFSTEELTQQSTSLNDEISDMKRKLKTGELTNVRIVRSKRRDLARVLTVLSEQLSKEAK